jgi:ATP-dependent Lhr-like helicase
MPATGPAARRALVVLVDGELVWFSERGGRSLLNFAPTPKAQRAAAGALAGLVGAGRVGGILVEARRCAGVGGRGARGDRRATADA